MASAACFAVGATPPALLAALLPDRMLTFGVVGASLGLLLVLGGVAARLGGASVTRGALRVGFWGAAAMGVTATAGRIFGAFD
jgi:VIT1/CCC1 family predicted Fe2+/Mn2+ transporter